MITISIVSHGQINLVKKLLDDLTPLSNKYDFDVILTINIPEVINFNLSSFPYQINLVLNKRRLGFGANHNQAFTKSKCKIFCILNPDIRMPIDPFTILLPTIKENGDAIVAPLVMSSNNQLEDSARKYPTLLILLKKIFINNSLKLDYEIKKPKVSVDWLAGMFLIMTSETFRRLGGFDRKYFMYYEDVDLCFRNNFSGFENYWITNTFVVHDAQRQSRRNLRYMKWHVKSCLLFLLTRLLKKHKK